MRHDEHGIPILGPEPEDPDAQKRANDKAQRSYEDKQTSLQSRMLYTQIALVAFGTIGALVSLWQANTAQQSADTTEKNLLISQRSQRESERFNALARLDAQAASALTAKQSSDSLNSTVSNFQKDQRPWLTVKAMNYSNTQVKGINLFDLSVSISNTGRSPAFDIYTANAGYVSNYGPINIDDWLKTHKLPQSLPSTSSVIASEDTFTLPMNPPITSEQDSSIKRGELVLYMIGDIHYVDGFKIRHLTRFCGLYNPLSNHFENCRFHTYVDRN